MKDYYNILGIDRSSSQDDIKRAYRKLAAQNHPDRGGDTSKFQEIQQAYDTLSDPDKRSQYDNPAQQSGFNFYSSGFPPEFDHIFSNFPGGFGDMFRRHQPRKNRSLNIQTSITLEDAFFGKEIIANLTLPSGKNQTLEIKIPPGIQDGNTLRLSGMGDDSIPNLPKGDIHLTVRISEHDTFQRHGDDLVKKLNLNCLDAILGKTINVFTIDKKELEIKINPGTQHDQVLAINNYGMPKIQDHNSRGRLLIHINIVIPTDLNHAQKELLKQIVS